MFDILITHGSLIDGTGAPARPADLGITRDQITQIGDLQDAEARHIIDATSKIVAPGFIDVHTHSDAWMLKTPHILSKTIQGFTTELLMADGISYAPVNRHTAHSWIHYLRALDALRFEEYQGWESLADYITLLDRRTAQNCALQIPYANVRALACGFGRSAPDDFQMRQILTEIERGLAAGAVGLSTGLDYIAECFASTDELVEACQPLRSSQAVYVTHVRYKKGTLNGVREAVEIGRRARVPVHISHLKGSSPAECEEILGYINQTAVNEVDFSFDVYPYSPGSTMLNYLLPYEIWEEGPLNVQSKLIDPRFRAAFAHSLTFRDLNALRIAWLPGAENAVHLGSTLANFITHSGRPAADALCDLLIEENLAVLLVLGAASDSLVDPFLSHSKYMMGTDGILHERSIIHPRQYGSAARLLGSCVRDRKLFSLEEAVRKLTEVPARRFGLSRRGTLQEGNFADVVVFDSAAISDRATYQQPHQFSVGVANVIVNGRSIIDDHQPITPLPDPLPGRALRFHDS